MVCGDVKHSVYILTSFLSKRMKPMDGNTGLFIMLSDQIASSLRLTLNVRNVNCHNIIVLASQCYRQTVFHVSNTETQERVESCVELRSAMHVPS